MSENDAERNRDAVEGGPDTIVLIHGLWMTPRSWEKWIDRYSNRGYRVLAPAWPGLEVEVEELNADPSPLARLDVATIVDHYDRIIRDLETPPIIMGHSFGGAFTQVLVDRGLGAAGVGIAAAPAKGILKLPLSTVRSSWSILRNPANRRRAVPLSESQFNYAFTNNLSLDQSRPVYRRYAVPGAGHVLFEGATANLSRDSALRVNYANPDRAPLLFIAGGIDHVVPAAVNEASVSKHSLSGVPVSYKEYPGRTHFTAGQDGWEEVADFALTWATRNARSTSPTKPSARPPTSPGEPEPGTPVK